MIKTSEKKLILENNIRVAYHTPDISSQSYTTCPPGKKNIAIISRPEFVTTSEYVAYHQRMGHTPPNIISVNSQQKNRLLENNNLPAELKNKRLFVVIDLSIQKKEQKKTEKKLNPALSLPALPCPSKNGHIAFSSG